MVARLHASYAFADGFDDTSTLVTEDDGEGTLGVFSGERVCIWAIGLAGEFPLAGSKRHQPVWQTPVWCIWTRTS